jgi:hypothetical protein
MGGSPSSFYSRTPTTGECEPGEVRVAVEPFEPLFDSWQPDVPYVGRWYGDLAHLLHQGDLLGVVDERQAFVVAGGIREQQSILSWQELVDRAQTTEVVVYLLPGDQVEPAYELGYQEIVLLAALLRAEIGHVPGDHEQPVRRLGGDGASRLRVPVLTEGANLRRDSVLVAEVWLGEG